MSAMDVEPVLEKLRAHMRSRGVEGIRGLGRHFKMVDRGGSGSVNADEFVYACRINNLGLSPAEVRLLMQAFDLHDNGQVNYQEFLRGVRGRLTQQRKKLVRMVFDALDAIGGHNGYLMMDDLKPVYSVTNHPLVKAGKMTKDGALQEMINGFEGLKEAPHDGKVSLEEWVRYYEEVSASIDHDDYFGNMLAGTWAHLKKKRADGTTAPVLKFTSSAEVEAFEKILINAMYAKVTSDVQLKIQVEKQFANIDKNKSGTVSMDEFMLGLEKFGMHVEGRRPGPGGSRLSLVQGLFDKYDVDASGALNYHDFVEAMLSKYEPPLKPHVDPGMPSGGRSRKGAMYPGTEYLARSNGVFRELGQS